MSKRKRRRDYRFIGLKVYPDTDPDIVDWWESIDEGERSETLRDLIRERLGRQARPPKRIEIPELFALHEDTRWIMSALHEMPSYLERMMQELMRGSHAQSVVSIVTPAPPMQVSGLREDEGERRAKRIGKRGW